MTLKNRYFCVLTILALVICICSLFLIENTYAESTVKTISIDAKNLTIKLGDTERIKITARNVEELVAEAPGNYVINSEWGGQISDTEMYLYVTGTKVGTSVLTVYDDYDHSISASVHVTVVSDTSSIESVDYIYKKTKTVKVRATNVVKGDIISFKIGKRTYNKKIKKTEDNANIKIKIKAPGFYGKKYKLTLVRKKKIVAKEIDYVYLSNRVTMGDTKKKVRWVTGWNSPVRKNVYAYSEQWCYDWDDDGITDAYLYFRNNKVVNWHTYE